MPSLFKTLLKKVFALITSLFAIVTVTFFLMHTLPGDPFLEEDGVPEEILSLIRHHHGLDQSLLIQYGRYLKNLLKGDFGLSLKYHEQRAAKFITEGFPISCTLGLEALFLSVSIGIPLGAFSAFRKDKWEDQLMLFFSVMGISVPSFVLATALQYLFALQLEWLPVARWGSFSQTILPTLSLAAFPTAVIAKLSRNSMIEVWEQDYILTAKAKGLNSFQIFTKHVLKNSLIPIITYLGPLTANIITGSFIVEKIFGIPGLGQWFMMSVSNRDYPLILSLTIFYSTILLGSVFLVDLIYFFLDPRMKKS